MRIALAAAAVLALAAAVLAKDEKAAAPPAPDPAKYESPPVGDLQVFPKDSPWNEDVSKKKVHAKSDAWVASIGVDAPLHVDCGAAAWQGRLNGIPYVVVDGKKQKRVPVEFAAYPSESDPGPYPVPLDAPIEGGDAADGDRHVLCVDTAGRRLYELYRAFRVPGGWKADCGAVFDLDSTKLRPEGWPSADAAGLPIFPGLLRFEEAKGEIRHALRFTVKKTQRKYVRPATHFASRSDDPDLPPMGMRVRLRPTVDEEKFPKSVRPVVRCLKAYGLLLADNGSDWFVTGAPDRRWDDDGLRALGAIRGKDFEVVDTGPLLPK